MASSTSAAAAAAERRGSGRTPPVFGQPHLQRGDPVRADDQRWQRVIAGRDDLRMEPEASAFAQPLVVVDARVVGKADHGMRETNITIGVKRVTYTRMPAPHDSGERVFEQHLVRQRGRGVRLRKDDEIEPEILGFRCPFPQRDDNDGDTGRVPATRRRASVRNTVTA